MVTRLVIVSEAKFLRIETCVRVPNSFAPLEMTHARSLVTIRAMSPLDHSTLKQLGIVRSSLSNRHNAPRQGRDGAPNAVIEIDPAFAEALLGLAPGDSIILITWLHQAKRDVLRVHPGHDPLKPIRGVFATRSPDRPNPVGLHRVQVLSIEGTRLSVGPLEAIDGTPVIDIKPVMGDCADS
jgi:tRNA-Thr(GGU) m(6)t(6)A37 methyltransferase TsaA